MFLCLNSLLINVVSLMAKDILRLSSSQPRPPLIFKQKSNTTGASGGAGTTDYTVAHEFIP
jgi:hypothetical protein